VRDDRLYVEHVLECIDRIQRYCREGEAAFFASELVQDAVLRNLQILAESTKRISDGVKANYPEVDWRGVAGFRNVLVHEYFGISLVRVWEIVSLNLPPLREQMEAIRHAFPQPE